MADVADPAERPPLRRFNFHDIPTPCDGLVYLYRRKGDGFWRIGPDADIALQEATGYPVGELMDHEARGDYRASESGDLLVLDMTDRSDSKGDMVAENGVVGSPADVADVLSEVTRDGQ